MSIESKMSIKQLPFTFGTVILQSDFINRQDDIERLQHNFLSGTNTIIISPRRWGKSSLVEKASDTLKTEKNLKICKLDLFNIRSEEEFYINLANEVLKTTSSKWNELVSNTKTFLSHFSPQISLGADNQTSVTFGISWRDLQKNPDDILNLAENIARSKNIKIVVCIDAFQNIATFSDSLAFQKKLRSHIQKHQWVSYCFYGSKRHMLMEVFTSPSMPFYKFGDVIFLDKIHTNEWVSFIIKRFHDTKKEITEQQAEKIVTLVDNHFYYVQQLAQQVWLRTSEKCTDDLVVQAHDNLIKQLGLLFLTLTENLSNTQLNYLKALLSGEEQMTSKEVLTNYNLGTSANAVRLKKTLIQNDILDNVGATLTFQDPLYRHWLRKYYFKLTINE